MPDLAYTGASLLHNQVEISRRYEESIKHLGELAKKRFWTLEPENPNRSCFIVKDQLGRVLYGPAHLYSVRGFFNGLVFQA